MKKILPLLISLLCLFVATVSTSLADYYRYTDSKGVTCMTNKLENVPAKYRSSMKVIKEETKKDPAAPQEVRHPESQTVERSGDEAAAPSPGIAGKYSELSARYPWFKPVVYLACIFALFLCVVKITTLLPSPLLARVIYIAFFVGVFIFLYQTFLNNFVHTSQKALNDASEVVKKSQVRQKALPEEEGHSPTQAAK